jgi:pyruvate formate lyase activating enzyme
MEGIIFDIKRFAIHDGPGIRTTVFFKGCPLSCFWCHNPESRKPGLEEINSAKIDKVLKLGRKVSVSALKKELLADRVFYESSGGGVTFSGGEPSQQMDFLEAVLTVCKQEGIHTAVDTSAFVKESLLRRILPLTDLFLFDLKMMDPEKHKKYTGVSNDLILSNLKMLVNQKASLDLRLPLIPGYNDSESDLLAMISFIKSLDGIGKIHLLPYHQTGRHKYDKFCLTVPNYEAREAGTDYYQKQANFFNRHGLETIHGG